MKSLRRQGMVVALEAASQIREAALKERLIGKDRQRGGAAALHGRSERGGGEVGADQPFGWRGLLEFRNDGGTAGGARTKRGGEAARA